MLFLGFGHASASEISSTADVMEAGKWSLTVTGRTVEIKPTVRISNNSAVQVNTTGGPTTIFSASNADVKMIQEFDSAIATIRYRPHDGLTYRFKAGAVQNFSLEYASGSHTNTLDTTGQGLVLGVGASWNTMPGTMVSPAITVDIGVTQTRTRLDRFKSPGLVVATDKDFVQSEVEGSVNVSKRFKYAEPYGGLKISHMISELTDGSSKEELRGKNDFVSPFVGISTDLFAGETVFFEASFVDEKALNFGMRFIF